MRKHFLPIVAGLAFALAARAVNPALPVIPATVFKVTSFGAKGDGVTDNGTNIQAAIDAANGAGGGVVEIPAGVFLSGPLTLRSQINLRLEAGAALRMLPYGQYPGGTTNAPPFITCNHVEDLEISGRGTIDGQGAAWWAAGRADRHLLHPMMLNLFSVNRLFIHDVTFTSPPFHHCGIRQASGNITISNLTVNTDPHGPNTDGLNLAGTNVLVCDCHITDGDDNIALASSGVLADVLITNCVFGSGHGVSIGSDVKHGVHDLTVANCSFTGGSFGLRLKADADTGGLAQHLCYHDLTMTNVQMPILIYSYYKTAGSAGKIISFTPDRAAALPVEPVTATTPVWRDLTFSNITATATVAGGTIWGKSNLAVSNVDFVNVNITAPGAFNIYNARGIRFQNCRLKFGGSDQFTTLNAEVVVTNTP